MIFPPATFAHHSVRVHYVPEQSIELQGIVAEFNLRSPHSFLFVDVSGGIGDQVERWEVELVSLAHLRRMGVDESTFQPGDRITVRANPNRNPDNPLVFGTGFVTGDGRTFGEILAPSDTSERQVVTGIEALEGRWQAPFPEPTTRSPFSLTSEGLAAWENYDPQLSPANLCEPISMPGIYYAPYLNDIEVNEGEVVFYHEPYSMSRTVPLNGPPSHAEPSGILGVVSGRVEGSQLIVESRDYPASDWGLAIAVGTNGGGADVPSSAEKSLIERYSVSEGGRTLTVEYTVSDPVYLSEPYTSSIELTRVADDAPMYDYVCELDSAERFSRDP
jgi:hypothetical protein